MDYYDILFAKKLNGEGGGGSSSDAAFQVKDFKVPSDKWCINQAIPNYIKDGGCLHIKLTAPGSTPSNDSHYIAVGADALSSWTSSTNCTMFLIWSASDGNIRLRLKGSTLNGTMNLTTYFQDESGNIDLKLYSDRYVNVLTGSSKTYVDGGYTSIITAMTNLNTHNYISVGRNYDNYAATGKIITLFAIESK